MAEENKRCAFEFMISFINLFLSRSVDRNQIPLKMFIFLKWIHFFQSWSCFGCVGLLLPIPIKSNVHHAVKQCIHLKKWVQEKETTFIRWVPKRFFLNDFYLVLIFFLHSGLFSLWIVWRNIKTRILYLHWQKILLQTTSGSSEANNRANSGRTNTTSTSESK
jgi:hypothetical protein